MGNKFKDYYSILRVSINSSPEEIKESYRDLISKYHPDKVKEDPKIEEKTKDINEAYEVLNNPTQRVEYNKEYKKYITAELKNFNIVKSKKINSQKFNTKRIINKKSVSILIVVLLVLALLGYFVLPPYLNYQKKVSKYNSLLSNIHSINYHIYTVDSNLFSGHNTMTNSQLSSYIGSSMNYFETNCNNTNINKLRNYPKGYYSSKINKNMKSLINNLQNECAYYLFGMNELTQALPVEETTIPNDKSNVSSDQSQLSTDQSQLQADQNKLQVDQTQNNANINAYGSAGNSIEAGTIEQDLLNVQDDQATVNKDQNNLNNAQSQLSKDQAKENSYLLKMKKDFQDTSSSNKNYQKYYKIAQNDKSQVDKYIFSI